jgi:phosphoglycolate phosphatase
MSSPAVLFDLDGTLLDTLDDIADSANRALVTQGFPAHPNEDFRRFIGDGVQMLVRRALPEDRRDDETIARVVVAYRDEYAIGWDVKTRPYPGIAELLDELAGRKVQLAVLSNKPDEFTRLCVAGYLGRWPFRVVLGQREDLPRKPDPTGALRVAAELGVTPAQCYFIGDSVADMTMARRAGMHAVGVAWGFQPVDVLREAGAETIVDRPTDLLPILDHEGDSR